MPTREYDELLDCYKQYNPSATEDLVWCKINNLQSVFHKELKKVMESKWSGASADDICTPQLWYFDSLLFTADQEQLQKGISHDIGIEDSDGEVESETEVSTL